jgi:uncharacterized metal-binding protein
MVHEVLYLQINIPYVHVKKAESCLYTSNRLRGTDLVIDFTYKVSTCTLKSKVDINYENLKKFGLLQYFYIHYIYFLL